MKKGFFLKLAISGIRNNKKTYFPYILTCVAMIMMSYILASLSFSPLLDNISGGDNLKSVLNLGMWVINIFALIFLFYTNTFLVRSRNREFGLYNVLGMDKKGLGRIISWETLIIFLGSMIIGIACGVLFSKLAELVLYNILKIDINMAIVVPLTAIYYTVASFIVIFLLIYIRSRIIIRRNNPLALMKSANVGEKPVKANWAAAIIGLILLGGSYYMAVSIKSPLTALIVFFIAVIVIIIATYMLMISGSVSLCKLLTKNKKYYYQSKHFVSVSSMAYRMKRNGAGLASICILSTMVLVMISSTFSLYIGVEDSLGSRYPRNINVEVKKLDNTDISDNEVIDFKQIIRQAAIDNSQNMKNEYSYRYYSLAGSFINGKLEADVNRKVDYGIGSDDICNFFFIPLKDYNEYAGSNFTLESNEALAYFSRAGQKYDTLDISGKRTVKIKEFLKDFDENGIASAMVIPSVYLIVDNIEEFMEPMKELKDYKERDMLQTEWVYGVDVSEDLNQQVAVKENILKSMSEKNTDENTYYIIESREENRNDFYMSFGGLFFLAIILSLVFICAAILIIYYKQINEGYEDKAGFDIMQKVGMTKKDIRKSINSQVLTVFYLPLIMAGLHLGFVFPMVWKILQLFNLMNLNLVIYVTIGAFLIFALFYTIIYKMTSNTYYSIVSKKNK